MKQNSIRLIVILGTLAIIGIVIIQIYWIKRAWDTNARQLNQRIYIALQSVAQNIFSYNRIEAPNDSPVNQLASNYYIVNTNSEIDAKTLEHFLITEFNHHNINLDFEYAIYDCSNDRMVYGNYLDASGQSKDLQESKILPRHEGLVYYFGVYFPDRENYLINQMWIWIIFSGILLVAMVFFCYALFVILKQKRLSELQKDFINNMTHEFKTPISSISISADVILDKESLNNHDRLQNYANLIKRENARLNDQVEKVLNIARLEKKGFTVTKEIVDIHEIVNTVAESIKSSSSNKLVELTTSLAASQPQILADKLHLTNILFSLLDNAKKYSHENVTIQINTEDGNKCIKLSISDNGIGISPEYKKKVFKKFFRVPTGNVHDVKGFGLGLYYVKNICSIHKWKISLESSKGKGTELEIQIPKIK